MEVGSKTSFNDGNGIAYEQYSDEESEFGHIKRKKLYPQCIIDSNSNSGGENRGGIEQEPRIIDLSEPCGNGQISIIKDELGETSRNEDTLDNSNGRNLTKGTHLTENEETKGSETYPEMGVDVSDGSVSDMVKKLLQSRKPGMSPLQCSECDLECPSLSALEFHTKLHVMERIVQRSYEHPGIGLKKPSKAKNDKHVDEAKDIESIMESLISREGSRDISYGDSRSGKRAQRPHKCEECGSRFASTSHLKRHMRTHTGKKTKRKRGKTRKYKLKKNAQWYNCPECEYKCRATSNLKLHMVKHSDERPFKCELCDSRFKTKNSLKLHMVKHSDVRSFKCKECDSSFKAKNNLKAHMQTHSAPKSFACTMCGYKCIKKAQLTRHMLKHTGKKPHACPLCDYRCNEKGNLDKHMVIHGDEKPFSCPEEGCDYKCKLKSNLKVHTLKHSGDRPFACNLCEYTSLTKGSLNTHMFKHTGEKPFPCSVCGNRYAVKGDLNVHMRIHTNDKKFKCTFCDYRCFTQQRVDEHMMTHTGEKPHECYVCGFCFTTTSHLKRHMRTHTGDKPYACTECDYKCARVDKLKIHMQAHNPGQKLAGRNYKRKDHMTMHNTEQKLYACMECDYSTNRNDYLKSHMKTHITGKLEQLKQTNPVNDLTINETINSLTISKLYPQFVPRKAKEGSSIRNTTMGDNSVVSYAAFGSHSVGSSHLPNDLPHHSELSNDSIHSHQTFHQGNAQSLNNQPVLGANNTMARNSQETTQPDIDYKMYSSNMENYSLSKRYSDISSSAKQLWQQGSSSIPAANTEGYNYQVLTDKLLHTRKVNMHAGDNLSHIPQNYSHTPMTSYPRPMFLDPKIPSTMPVPPNMSEMIRHANNMYNI